MYDNHVPTINAAMRSSPKIFARGCMFAILSARMQFITVPDQLKALAKDGANCKYLFSWKGRAFDYIEANKAQLWRDACAATDPAELIAILCRVPGLGIVKAAFVAQFLGHDIACLDTRNIAREGRNPRAYRSDGEARKTMPAFRRKIARYVRDTGGKARSYWDDWCADVAPVYGITAYRASELHLAIVPRSFRLTKPAPSFTPVNEIPF